MKKGARVLGVDDAAFEFGDDQTFLVGVVYRGTEFIEDVRAVDIEVDGDEATDRLVQLHDRCNNPGQVRAVLVDGISFAGFNLVDIHEASSRLGKPVIAVTGNRPDPEKFRDTMERTGNRDPAFEKLDDARSVELKDGSVYIQFAGTSYREARDTVRSSTIHGLTPEPVRVAHMIGRAFLR